MTRDGGCASLLRGSISGCSSFAENYHAYRTLGRAVAPSRRRAVACAVAVSQTLLVSNAWANDFLIEEVTEFPAPCNVGGPLNTCTLSLYNALIADSLVGSRFSNGMAWPQDFQDRNRVPGGLDHLFADANPVVVFSGHGRPGTIYFGPHDDVCTADTENNMRLSAASDSAGGKASLAIWLACEVLNVDLVGDEKSINNLRQQLGFLNRIGIDSNEPRDVYVKTKTQANVDAWLSTMGGPGGKNPVTREAENRRPIVVTKTLSTQESACWAIHDSLSWALGSMYVMPGQAEYTCWEWLD